MNEEEKIVFIEDEKDKSKEVNKNSFGRGIIIGIVISVIIFLVFITIGVVVVIKDIPQLSVFPNTGITEPAAEETTDGDSVIDMDRVKKKAKAIEDLIRKYSLYGLDSEEAETGIYRGIVGSLDDDYAEYYTEKEYEDLQTKTDGAYCGIGVVIQTSKTSNVYTVTQVFEGSPAEEAGVLNGDIIYAVGDLKASDCDMNTLVDEYIKGPEGTYVTITFLRKGEFIDLEIERRQIDLQTVSYELFEDNIGLITVASFAANTDEQFIEAIEDLKGRGMEKLIIDLRGNPGGMLDASINMLDYLLPEGLITYTADKNGEGQRYYSDEEHQLDIPMAILVDGNTASSSEVFTGAMMDYDAATVIGTNTFGKGIVQGVYRLTDGSALKFTTEHYYTPNGTDLHGEGLKPDIELELSEDCREYFDENDNQLAKAIEVLSK